MVNYIKINHSLKLEEKIDDPPVSLLGEKYGKGRENKKELKGSDTEISHYHNLGDSGDCGFHLNQS